MDKDTLPMITKLEGRVTVIASKSRKDYWAFVLSSSLSGQRESMVIEIGSDKDATQLHDILERALIM